MNAITPRIEFVDDFWKVLDARKSARALLDNLTPRQKDVIVMISMGMTNDAIGRALHISGRTAECHKKAAFKWLGIKTTSEAVVIATRAGMGE